MRRRVLITGAGIVSSAGPCLAEAGPAFVAGRCCLSPLNDPKAAKLRAKFAGIARAFDSSAASAQDGDLALQDRHTQMALVAAREALAAARLDPRCFNHRLGLIFSTCSGPMLRIEAHYRRILSGDASLTLPELFAKRYYSAAQALADVLGVQGFTTTVATACSASTAAIALAADLIRCGMLDAAIAGGADSLSLSTLAGFDGLKATSESRCAPFSKPYGLNLGEAAAFLILECPNQRADRQPTILGEILGSGTSNDAHHCSAPDPNGRGLALSMHRALRDAGLGPTDIAYINAHGTGTEANDRAEIKAVRKVFGPDFRIPISSTKSMVGHCLGAAGAVEAIATLACAQAGVLPPTANFTEAREGCSIDCVPDAGRPWNQPRICLSNNSAFGGHNASLVLHCAAEHPSPQTVSLSPEVEGRAWVPLVITGIGVVTAAGLGSAALATASRNGQPFLARHTLSDGRAASAAMVNDLAVDTYDRRLDLRSMDRASRWATVAARLAIRDARFPESSTALADLGLFLGLSAGPSWAEHEFLTSFLRNHDQVSQLGAFPYIVPSSVVGNICRALRITGHNLTFSSGPGAGLHGLLPALSALRCGHAQALLSGAVDELSDRILADETLSGPSIPGLRHPPGEGAAFFLLETAAHAAERQVVPLAHIRAVTSAHTPGSTATSSAAFRTVVHDALNAAGVPAEAVQVVHHLGPDDGIADLHPLWPARCRSVAASVGCLEGSQPLVDIATTLADRDPSRHAIIAATCWIPGRLASCLILET
ncbi:MAG: beta-ketoacyl-[acyl-carrier-protein] synthase family protein [Verrucomicrobiales bacterium]|nr:beta-ketoacyl-[acyl-carrier-protein] synthase family protein [Verrucomicrobiales bacterium]